MEVTINLNEIDLRLLREARDLYAIVAERATDEVERAHIRGVYCAIGEALTGKLLDATPEHNQRRVGVSE